MQRATVSAVLILLVCLGLGLGHPRRAHADDITSARYTTIYLGVIDDSSTVHNNPTLGSGGSAYALPTFAFRQWGHNFVWGFDCEGMLAAIAEFVKIGYTSDGGNVVPLIGGDVGYAFGLFGGLGSINFAFEGVGVRLPPMAGGVRTDATLNADFGGQLQYTHPMGDKMRLSALFQIAKTGDGKSLSGTQASVGLGGILNLTGVWGVYGGLTLDLRTYKDASLEHGEWSFSTVMVRFGLVLNRNGLD